MDAVEKLERAGIESAPFPHAIVDGLLDESAYAALLAAATDPATPYSTWTNNKHRAAVPLPAAGEELVSPRFTRAMCRLFAAQLRARGLEPERLAEEGRWVAKLSRDVAGFGLVPHLDTQLKAVSTLLYVAPDASLPGQGTTLYGGPAADSKVGRIDYLPNRWFAFVPGTDTWHGVEEVPEGSCRYAVNATLRFP